ncbi:hypothetical protein NQ314_019280 [Rhamnusium bicolor]|uniref:HAT C-terminal dimerisation domain-containing protein n=1 Tax=Rhamnusium bicolor TaxID=1586634 RepID=A0AAV8WP23_9CUCU|nr:hypothetical protein NQ314_019280 [Rhamnusium bicolor]
MSIDGFVNLFPSIEVDIESVNTEWQLLSYTSIPDCDKTTDLNIFLQKVSEFKNALGFPNLIQVVKIVLSLPQSSATAERTFSQLTLIKTSTRNRLLIKTCTAIPQIKAKLKSLKGVSLEWNPNKETQYNNQTLHNIVL